jgi:hypothetical protein
MTRRTDPNPTAGLLHELDTLRTLLDAADSEADLPLLTPALDAAIRDGIDAAIQGWLQDTLAPELDILRARLFETVRSEIRARLALPLNSARVRDPDLPTAAATEDSHGQ